MMQHPSAATPLRSLSRVARNSADRIPRTRLAIVFTALMFAVACGDQAPESGPGTLSAHLSGPETSQGAAELRLIGPGIQAVLGVSGQVFSRQRGDTVDVVVVRETPGQLSFSVQLADTTAIPVATVLEVAGPDNVLRANPAAYSVRMGGDR